MEDKSQWSKFVDDHQIAKIEEHNSRMVMNVLDFEAMEAFMTTDDMKAWDANNGCVDIVYSLSPAEKIFHFPNCAKPQQYTS